MLILLFAAGLAPAMAVKLLQHHYALPFPTVLSLTSNPSFGHEQVSLSRVHGFFVLWLVTYT